MDKPLRTILIVVLVITAANMAITFFQKSQLNQIKQELKQSQTDITTALKNIKASQTTIAAIQNNLTAYQGMLQNEQTTVEILEAQKLINEANAKGTINKNIQSLKIKLDSLYSVLAKPQPLIPINN